MDEQDIKRISIAKERHNSTNYKKKLEYVDNLCNITNMY